LEQLNKLKIMENFIKSNAGKKFLEKDLPKLISVLENIGNAINESNKINQKQFILEHRKQNKKMQIINDDVPEYLKDHREEEE